MMKTIAVFFKEWKLLCRDKVGLIFLFILPMCLVLFITLTSSESSDSPRQLKLLLINQDASGNISQALTKALKKIDGFEITDASKDSSDNLSSEKNAVSKGDYQSLIFIPAGVSKQINDQVKKQTQKGKANSHSNAIKILFDPALPKNLQLQITAAVQLITANIESQLWQQVVTELMRMPKNTLSADESKNLLTVDTDFVKTSGTASSSARPNDVQQNVPAWALFGMFFIITPLSGVLVKERKLGVMARLRLAPVSLLSLIWGKIYAFVCINLLQLTLMLAVGVFILPLFGLPTLEVTTHLNTIFLVGLSASLAATGFGMLIGSLVKTPEQANVIGPFIIVIVAAIGGIFVPTYLLPESFQNITNLSPMNWALQAFIDIFVRDATLSQLLPNISKLLIFALCTISLASLILARFRR